MNDIRLPPQDLDAERCVLGSLLFLNAAIDQIDLKADEFYSGHHSTAYEAVRGLWSNGCRGIDVVTLANELSKRGELDQVGGMTFLAELLEAVPHAAHAAYYADIVRTKARQRQLITACTETITRAYDDDSADLLAAHETKLLNIRDTASGGELVTMNEAVDALEALERNPAAVHSTGLADLDRQIRGGLRDSQFVIVGGRPGSGKSVLAAQIATAFAQRGEPSLIVSLEMDRGELAERCVKSIDRQKLRSLPIFIEDTASQADAIAATIRLAARKHGIRLAVLDYLQLAESSDRKANRERQVAAVSRMCKRLAMELKIPILAACQLNRESTKEQRPPRLSDLRESGSIEQDADIVILLHLDEFNAKAIVAKHRNGSTGIVPLTFRPERFRFENHAHYEGRH
jgi:replicative DNA helicase